MLVGEYSGREVSDCFSGYNQTRDQREGGGGDARAAASLRWPFNAHLKQVNQIERGDRARRMDEEGENFSQQGNPKQKGCVIFAITEHCKYHYA